MGLRRAPEIKTISAFWCLRTRCALFACRTQVALRALYLASGMALSLIVLVPGLLFTTNPSLSASATRTPRFPAPGTYDFYSFQKNDKNHRVNHFLGLPVQDLGARPFHLSDT